MREIKFRAWDRGRSEMLPITSMNWSEWWVSCEPILEDSVLPLAYGDRNSFKNEDTDRHILMQYTGLKDRNGKEIYEGDIVRVEPKNGYGYITEDTDIGVITWVTGYYMVEMDKQTPFFMLYCAYFEVIGNIYENPEVLGGSEI